MSLFLPERSSDSDYLTRTGALVEGEFARRKAWQTIECGGEAGLRRKTPDLGAVTQINKYFQI